MFSLASKRLSVPYIRSKAIIHPPFPRSTPAFRHRTGAGGTLGNCSLWQF